MEGEEVREHGPVGGRGVVCLVAEGGSGVEDEEGEVEGTREGVGPEGCDEDADGGRKRALLFVSGYEEVCGGVCSKVEMPNQVCLAGEGGEEGEECGEDMGASEDVEVGEEKGEQGGGLSVEEEGVEEGDGVEPDGERVCEVCGRGRTGAGAEGGKDGGEDGEGEKGGEEGGEA